MRLLQANYFEFFTEVIFQGVSIYGGPKYISLFLS
jgi:hypothetical protein